MEQKITTNEIIESGKIELDGKVLLVDKNGLIKIIKSNNDKSSLKINENILRMIKCFYGHFTLKQSTWLLEKVKYVLRHNDEYRKMKKIDDIVFL